MSDSENQLQMTTAIGNVQGAFKTVPSAQIGSLRAKPLPSTVRLAPADQSKSISGCSTIALWFLKPGLDPALLTVKQIYRMLRDIAYKTQQDGDVAFFELYPDAVIRSDSEKATKPVLTRSDLINDYRLYCKRLAHWVYYYIQVKKLWTCSLLNTFALSRLNGNERIKTIASAFKYQTWASNAAQFSSFPQPCGYTNSMIENARIAIGKSATGAELAAIPIIEVSIFGNLGQHTQSILDFISTSGSTDHKMANIMSYADLGQDTEHSSDARLANQLLQNMYRTISQYANSASSVWKKAARDPFIENGSSVSLVFDDTEGLNDYSGTSQMNVSGNMSGSTNGSKSNFITSQEGNFSFWQDVMFTFFSEMRNPSSDKYVIVSDLLKLVEKELTFQEISDAGKKLKCFDIHDLAKHMVYKDKAQVNTATIVRVAPPITDDITNALSDDSNFAYNWERYDVDSSDYADVIRKAKAYPDLTPAVFADLARNVRGEDVNDRVLPFVLNSVSKSGAVGNLDSPVRIPYGSDATLMDIAIRQSVDSSSVAVDFVGFTPAAMQEYLDKASNAVVFSEDPSYISVLHEPIIDTTDIFCCGFTVLISNDTADASEWSQMLRDPKYFPNLKNGVLTKCQQLPKAFIFPSETFVPQVLAFTSAINAEGNKAKIAHTANPEYMQYIKHACVFVGGGLLNHPFIVRNSLQSGNPVSYFAPKTQRVSGTGLLMASRINATGLAGPAWLSGDPSDTADERGSESLDIFVTKMFNEDANETNPSFNFASMILSMMALAGSTDDIAPGVPIKAVDRPQHALLNKWMFVASKPGAKIPLRYEQYVIDPKYGPVTPITSAMPLAGFFPNSVGECDIQDDPFKIDIPQAANNYGIEIAAGANSQNDGEHQSQMTLTPAFIANIHAATFWLWFLDSLTFKNVRAQGNALFTSLKIPENTAGKLYFSTEAKAVLALLSRGTTEGSMTESTKSYYNQGYDFVNGKVDIADHDYDLINEIVVPPRIPRTSKVYNNEGGIITGSDNSARGAADDVVKSAANRPSNDDASRRSGSNNRGGGRSKPRVRSNGLHNQASSNGNARRENAEPDGVYGQTSIVGADDVSNGGSTNTIDKGFNKKNDIRKPRNNNSNAASAASIKDLL